MRTFNGDLSIALKVNILFLVRIDSKKITRQSGLTPAKQTEVFPYYVLSEEITNLFSYFTIRMDGDLRFCNDSMDRYDHSKVKYQFPPSLCGGILL